MSGTEQAADPENADGGARRVIDTSVALAGVSLAAGLVCLGIVSARS